MNLARRSALLAAAALALAACSGPAVPLGITELLGTVYDPPGAVDPPQVLAVGMLLVDEDEAEMMAASNFAEVEPGVFFGLATTVVDDGSFAIQLPAEEDIPDGVLVAAADALWDVVDAGCTVTAEPPTAKVTQGGLSLFPVPLLYGFTEEGLVPLVATPTAIEDGVPYEGGFLSWLYADVPVTLATDDACADFDVVLELKRGWNQVLWTPGGPATLLRDAVDEDTLATAVFF